MQTYPTGLWFDGLCQPPGWTKKVEQRQNSAFSDYGHNAYQIKGNGAYSNMVAKSVLVDPTPGP